MIFCWDDEVCYCKHDYYHITINHGSINFLRTNYLRVKTMVIHYFQKNQKILPLHIVNHEFN